MKRYGVRPSVCPQQRTSSCRFAAVGPAGGRYRLLQQRPVNAGNATLSACVGSWTQTRFSEVS